MPSRLRRQTNVRRGYVKTIVTKMAQKLQSKAHRKRMETTNRLLPLRSLQRNCVQKKFSGWILDLVGEGRILTKKLAEQVYSGLRKKLKLGPNDSSKELEVRRLHHVLKAARKRQVGKKKPLKKPWRAWGPLWTIWKLCRFCPQT
jgi:hypothetical protein